MGGATLMLPALYRVRGVLILSRGACADVAPLLDFFFSMGGGRAFFLSRGWGCSEVGFGFFW